MAKILIEDTRKPKVGWAIDKNELSDMCVCDVSGELSGDLCNMTKPCHELIYSAGELVYCYKNRYLNCKFNK